MNNDSALRGGARVAVVTVAYRSDAELGPFLVSTGSATTDKIDVVVVDNLPAVGNAERIAEEHGARYLALGSNPGYGGAINAAVKSLEPSTEWILISNPDVILASGSIDALVRRGESDGNIAAVGPRILTPFGDTYPSARAIPSVAVGVGHALLADRWPSNPWTRSYHASEGYEMARTTGWLSGSCVLVRRSAFDEIGGFDASYFMYFEDVDLGFRLGRAGWLNIFEPKAEAMHIGAKSTTSESTSMLKAHHRSAERFLSARYPKYYQWPLRAALLIGLRIRWVVQRSRRS